MEPGLVDINVNYEQSASEITSKELLALLIES